MKGPFALDYDLTVKISDGECRLYTRMIMLLVCFADNTVRHSMPTGKSDVSERM